MDHTVRKNLANCFHREQVHSHLEWNTWSPSHENITISQINSYIKASQQTNRCYIALSLDCCLVDVCDAMQ